MADIITKATRIGYAEGLLYLGETDEKVIVMDADLAGATQTAKFKANYADRFFNCGIAEQNMIG
ncbi:MAG: transketolase family protein, partial [Clostridia bacterium]|nr:transketolase family protein [Clostridia bacterium]